MIFVVEKELASVNFCDSEIIRMCQNKLFKILNNHCDSMTQKKNHYELLLYKNSKLKRKKKIIKTRVFSAIIYFNS